MTLPQLSQPNRRRSQSLTLTSVSSGAAHSRAGASSSASGGPDSSPKPFDGLNSQRQTDLAAGLAGMDEFIALVSGRGRHDDGSRLILRALLDGLADHPDLRKIIEPNDFRMISAKVVQHGGPITTKALAWTVGVVHSMVVDFAGSLSLSVQTIKADLAKEMPEIVPALKVIIAAEANLLKSTFITDGSARNGVTILTAAGALGYAVQVGFGLNWQATWLTTAGALGLALLGLAVYWYVQAQQAMRIVRKDLVSVMKDDSKNWPALVAEYKEKAAETPPRNLVARPVTIVWEFPNGGTYHHPFGKKFPPFLYE